ncbi:MAG: hypothetical protein QOI08_561, partial [Actinomycetota bacterium]|nr:hypothetical protein [Actinomycetota bacterium]
VAPVHIGDLLELAAEITTIDRGVATVSAIAQVSGKAVVTASAMAVVIDR